mmetsp:Transcript_89270/g.252557  ORF Transcript_89270/g.252557 Transcript_89270/m.252557 type:complete len:234 (-) Transcript_89270:391-1092(-)
MQPVHGVFLSGTRGCRRPGASRRAEQAALRDRGQRTSFLSLEGQAVLVRPIVRTGTVQCQGAGGGPCQKARGICPGGKGGARLVLAGPAAPCRIPTPGAALLLPPLVLLHSQLSVHAVDLEDPSVLGGSYCSGGSDENRRTLCEAWSRHGSAPGTLRTAPSREDIFSITQAACDRLMSLTYSSFSVSIRTVTVSSAAAAVSGQIFRAWRNTSARSLMAPRGSSRPAFCMRAGA